MQPRVSALLARVAFVFFHGDIADIVVDQIFIIL
jgi:hypothetical protein